MSCINTRFNLKILTITNVGLYSYFNCFLLNAIILKNIQRKRNISLCVRDITLWRLSGKNYHNFLINCCYEYYYRVSVKIVIICLQFCVSTC